ncbi:MAG: DUF1385 domain-containing protein [Lachnospiraceae bacterium]|nr:DUF1385 domain-containing protein [Lachnospiraceae bacterium]
MKSSQIGGQAVLEGVMMRNNDKYAVAVRKPDKEIEVKVEEYHSLGEKSAFFRIPIIRGVVNFIEALIVGMNVLTYSSSFYDDEVKESKLDKAVGKIFKGKAEAIIVALTIMLSLVMAVGIFFVLPYGVSRFLSGRIQNEAILAAIEGVLRLIIFFAYVMAISLMEDIKRTFMYHGAEHKCINCVENGKELTVENVRRQSRFHKRCGTSFLFLVMFISIIFFMFIRVKTGWLRLVIRLLLVPVIAGVSYEFIRLAGRSEDGTVASILSKPGLWLQRLTTKEPDDSMIEVAIASVEAVFDWKAFLEENFTENIRVTREERVGEAVAEPVATATEVLEDAKDVAKEEAPKTSQKSNKSKKKNKSKNKKNTNAAPTADSAEPAVAEPTVAEPAVAEPAVAESATEEPATEEPAVEVSAPTVEETVAEEKPVAAEEPVAMETTEQVEETSEPEVKAAVEEPQASEPEVKKVTEEAAKQQVVSKIHPVLKATDVAGGIPSRSEREKRLKDEENHVNAGVSAMLMNDDEDDEILSALDRFFDEENR